MTCQEVLKNFTVYVEGNLSPEEAQELEAHLRVCASCRSRFEAYKRTVHLIKELNPVRPPALQIEFLYRSIRSRIGRRHSSGIYYPKRRKYAWLIVTAAIALFMFWNTYLKGPGPVSQKMVLQQKQENAFLLEEHALSNGLGPIGQQAYLAAAFSGP